MENMKSLADQIREELVRPEVKKKASAAPKNSSAAKPEKKLPDIVAALREFDTANHKNMVHVRFDERTVRTMNQFKMATGIDVTRFVAFAVSELLTSRPEIRTIIKQFIQNTDL